MQTVISQIEQWAAGLLTTRGFVNEGEEHRYWVVLYHLFSAAAIYEAMAPEERKVVNKEQRLMKGWFNINFSLKEKKRKRKEKEKNSPTPPKKDKESPKENQEKNTHTVADAKPVLDDDQKVFWNECSMYIGNPYDEQMIRNFFHYWAEKDPQSGKMLWQTKRTWDTKFRLIKWANNSNTKRDEAASIELKRKQGRVAQQGGAQQQQKKVGLIDAHEVSKEKAAHVRELKKKEIEQDSLEAFIRTHPNSALKDWKDKQNDSGGLTP